MKKIVQTSLVSALIFSPVGNIFSAGDEICGQQEGYSMYECRVENICEIYKSEKPVYNSKDYQQAENMNFENGHNIDNPVVELDAAKSLYRENIGNIYKCAIIQSQSNAIENLKEFIGQENSGRLSDTIGGQLELRLNRLDISANTIGCTLADTDNVQNKLNILHETSYQACKHVSYLEYLKVYYEKTGTIYSEEKQREIYGNDFSFSSTPQEVEQDINRRKNAVAQEISHTYNVFPIAYHAYSEYENNFPIHFLLEIIRADFLLLREGLRDNLMPIAQLGLKIINAMSH